ncbi:MAG: hypothetical protein Q9195_002336 [Heterodermia aff. obscurata]
MVDVNLLAEMPSPVRLRRNYDRETQRMKRAAKKTTSNKAFQGFEWASRKEKWIRNMELDVLARRGLQVRPPASQPAGVMDSPQQATDLPQQATDLPQQATAISQQTMDLQQARDIPQQATDITQETQPSNVPRTLARPRQRREAMFDIPREHREDTSHEPRRQRGASRDTINLGSGENWDLTEPRNGESRRPRDLDNKETIDPGR